MKPKLIISILAILWTTISYTQTAKHILLIGLDGVSAEGFQYSSTPTMDELIKNGCISLKTRSVMPTVSAPNWATILSGSGPEQHGVTSNEWSLANEPFEPTVKDADGYFTSIFSAIHKQLPTAKTGMFYDWDWLGTFINPTQVTSNKFVSGYQNVTPLAIDFIKQNKPLFTFVYYGHPDEVGHEIGHGTSAYFQSINDVDKEIAKLIAALKEAGIYETTTILIVSDHGGIGKGHGGENRIEMEVPWIAKGPGIAKNKLLVNPNDQANTAPTILKLLGLKAPAEWIGRANTEAFSQKTDVNRKFPEFIRKPFSSAKEGTYASALLVNLGCLTPGTTIYYTLDGSQPGPSSKTYTTPFNISSNTTITTIASKGNSHSDVMTWRYTFVKGVKSVSLSAEPSAKYPGTGAMGLFDGFIGSSNYKGKQWMGWEGDNVSITVDFGETKEISSIGLDVLQLPATWIFLPALSDFESSTDGENFTQFSSYNPAEVDDNRKDGPVLLTRLFEPMKTRFLRISITNQGVCPAGHPGEGQKAWLFLSEIEVE